MRRQFLLNPDGSTPEGIDLDLLRGEGIALVLPAPLPRKPGMVAVEQDPQQDAYGVWRQVWSLEPAPEPPARPETASDPLAFITPEQKAALLALLQGAPTP
jgi:hypothetical protein